MSAWAVRARGASDFSPFQVATNAPLRVRASFSSGKADSAPFWIQMGPKFIHIEYFAIRNDAGEYIGTLEVSADLTEKRALGGEQRILSYKK